MTLTELDSDQAVQAFLAKNPRAVVTYSATWCGPCNASKPDLTRMAHEYATVISKGVVFGIVYEHILGEAIHKYGVRAFPTYILFVNRIEVGRVEGANLNAVRDLINKLGPSVPSGTAYSLGGGQGTGTQLSKEEARARRLAKLGGETPDVGPNQAVEPGAKASEPVLDVEMELTDKPEGIEGAKTDPMLGLDADAIQTLTQAMGFSLLRAQKGLLFGSAPTAEAAIEWIMLHQNDDDIDDEIPVEPIEKAHSYKCNECGKILSNMANLELHANKTGHSDFEESTTIAQTLTPEEKIQKIAEIKKLLKVKRAEREEKEKNEEIEREKERRLMGKEVARTKEQMEAERRKLEQWRIKKDKETFKRERERLLAELARDKAERKANKGKLGSRLGVDGYRPDRVQYDVADGAEVVGETAVEVKPKTEPSSAKIDEYIKKVASYRAGGDGGKCLKVLLAYVGNIVDNLMEVKFKSINTENKVFKSKVAPFVGAKQLLFAVGFKQNSNGTTLVLDDAADTQLLAKTKGQLQAAFDTY